MVLDSRVGDGLGVDLCRNIRELDQITPILFYSGVAHEKNKKEALNAGAQGYLVKPASIPELYETVRELISTPARRGFDGSSNSRKNSGELAVAPGSSL